VERWTDRHDEANSRFSKSCQCPSQQLKSKIPTWCHLLFYFTSYVLNMFRALMCPSSGACDCVENKTADVVIQQHSRKLLMMDILIAETCWAQKKWNKIASDIKLVFYSSTITTMHGPINISQSQYIALAVCHGAVRHCISTNILQSVQSNSA